MMNGLQEKKYASPQHALRPGALTGGDFNQEEQ
jgi:hypothetical protein